MSSGETKPLLEKRRSSGSGDKKRFYFIQDRHPSQVSHDGQIQREAPEIEISTIPVRGKIKWRLSFFVVLLFNSSCGYRRPLLAGPHAHLRSASVPLETVGHQPQAEKDPHQN